jgi:hypothetical protein
MQRSAPYPSLQKLPHHLPIHSRLYILEGMLFGIESRIFCLSSTFSSNLDNLYSRWKGLLISSA